MSWISSVRRTKWLSVEERAMDDKDSAESELCDLTRSTATSITTPRDSRVAIASE